MMNVEKKENLKLGVDFYKQLNTQFSNQWGKVVFFGSSLLILSGCCRNAVGDLFVICPDQEGFPNNLRTKEIGEINLSDTSVSYHEDKTSAEPPLIFPAVYMATGPSFFSGNTGNNKPLPSFEFGPAWSFPVTDHLQFEPGIQYRSIGNKNIEESEVNDPDYYYYYRFEEIVRLNYIDLNPFLSYQVSPRINLLGGPSFSYLVGAKRINKSEHSTRKERTTDGVNKWNIGADIQAFYHPENSFFAFGLGYNHGFSNVNGENMYTPGMDKKYSNSVTLIVTYKLPAGYLNYKKYHARSMSAEENRRRDEERKRRYEEERRNPRPKSSKMK